MVAIPGVERRKEGGGRWSSLAGASSLSGCLDSSGVRTTTPPRGNQMTLPSCDRIQRPRSDLGSASLRKAFVNLHCYGIE